MKKYLASLFLLIIIYLLMPRIIEKDEDNTLLANKLLTSFNFKHKVTVYLTEETSQYIPILNIVLIGEADQLDSLVLAHEVAHSINQYEYLRNMFFIFVLFFLVFRVVPSPLVIQALVLLFLFIPLISPIYELQADYNGVSFLNKNNIKFKKFEPKPSMVLVSHPRSKDRVIAFSSKSKVLNTEKYSIIKGVTYAYLFYFE